MVGQRPAPAPAGARRRPARRESGSALVLWLSLGGGALVLVGIAVTLLLVLGPGSGDSSAPSDGLIPAGFLGKKSQDTGQDGPRKIALDAASEQIRLVLFAAPQARQAVVYSEVRGTVFKNVFERYDLATGKKLGTTEIPSPGFLESMSLSPDGTHLAVSFGDKIAVWSLAQDREIVGDLVPNGASAVRSQFQPGPEQIIHGKAALLGLLDNERLLTVHVGGGRTLWQAKDKKEIYSFPSEGGPKRINHLVDIISRRIETLALSPDRSTVAVFNGQSYNLFDTKSGKLLRKTAGLKTQGNFFSVQATAFSPDNKQLACRCLASFAGPAPQDALVRWAVATGAEAGRIVFSDRVSPGSLDWWAADLVLISRRIEGTIVDLKKGRLVQHLDLRDGQFGWGSADGRLWYANGAPKAFLTGLAPAHLGGLATRVLTPGGSSR